jgi:hypothetical protein
MSEPPDRPLSEPPDRSLSEPPPPAGHGPPQFSLRAVLLFVTACCVLFAILAGMPGRMIWSVFALVLLLFLAARAVRKAHDGIAWMVGGAAVGLTLGIVMGAGMVIDAYGPVSKQEAWSDFWELACDGLTLGGLTGYLVASVSRGWRMGRQ